MIYKNASIILIQYNQSGNNLRQPTNNGKREAYISNNRTQQW